MLKSVAQVTVFFLELAMLGALAFCGYRLGKGQWTGWMMAIVFPALFIVLWGIWAAPKSSKKLPPRARLSFRLSLFFIAFGCLACAGYPAVGISLFLLAVLAEWLGGTAKV